MAKLKKLSKKPRSMPVFAVPIRTSVSRVSQLSLVLRSTGRNLKTSAEPILTNVAHPQNKPRKCLTDAMAATTIVVAGVHRIRQQSAAGMDVRGPGQVVSVALPLSDPMYRRYLTNRIRKVPVMPEAAAGMVQVVIVRLLHRKVRHYLVAGRLVVPG